MSTTPNVSNAPSESPGDREEQSVPFPSSHSEEDHLVMNSESYTSNPESDATTSSKLTSSDKLSALPVPGSPGSPNPNRVLRSPVLGASRTLRRGMNGSSSLPSLPSQQTEGGLSPPLKSSAAFPHASASEGSIGADTPKKVSFDSDRGSIPGVQSIRNVFTRMSRTSDPILSSPEKKNNLETPTRHDIGSRSVSPSNSRAASPFRAFQQWSAGLRSHHNHPPSEEPFIPVDPFSLKIQFHWPRIPCTSSDAFSVKNDLEMGERRAQAQCSPTVTRYANNTSTFFTSTLPRLIYLHLLLRLPAMYFTRVARVFRDAEVSRPDIQRMIDASMRGAGVPGGYNDAALFSSVSQNLPPAPNHSTSAALGLTAQMSTAPLHVSLPFPDDWTPSLVSPALVRFKHSWEAFIDSLLREWKTLNVISALLLSAIVSMFQVPEAMSDPITRTAALLSLICALMSLSYGCMYIVRFGTMRSMYRASRWAEEAQKTNTVLWWNVWVLLAMPGVWMSWSMICFIVAILSFVWRTGSVNDPQEREGLSPTAILGPRIAITFVFCIGMVYFVLIVQTLKNYGLQGGIVTIPDHVHAQAQGEDRRGRERQRNLPRVIRKREETNDATDPRRGRGGEESARGSPRSRPLNLWGLGLVNFPEPPSRESGEIPPIAVAPAAEQGDKESSGAV